MPESDTLPVLVGTYGATVTPLKSGGRSDWNVAKTLEVAPVQAPDFIDAMRRFFDGMDREITHYVDDPIATSQALARVDALLADVRYVRDRLRDVTAVSMNTQRIRRLTVESVTTVEASSTVEWDWDDRGLMEFVLSDLRLVDADTGELYGEDVIAERILSLLAPRWRSTALKEQGINANDWRETPLDEQGKPIRKPTITIKDNRVRRNRS